jgi:hypothetical protein
MKWQDYYCLLLGMTSPKASVCRPQAAVAGSVSQWPLALPQASIAESKQNTDDKLKAYLTDIMWIITRSLVLR